ncbi:MAG TPA: hypothetical protein VIK51_03395 [Vicinamibacteria bacterium]
MKRWDVVRVVVVGLAVAMGTRLASPNQADDHASCPHRPADAHGAGVDHRHDQTTGMAPDTSVHRFEITSRGGVIRLEAASVADEEGRDAARRHLEHVAQSFAAGDFSMPMFIHGQVPPGASAMTRLRDAIRYRHEPTDRGGQITIDTSNREARRAIHEFLRFQIRDHRTGE